MNAETLNHVSVTAAEKMALLESELGYTVTQCREMAQEAVQNEIAAQL